MKKTKAQISIEYVIIIGLILFALAIAVGIAFFYSGSAKHQITANQIDKIGDKIVDTADSIYYLGYPSKATIELTMPNNIIEILVENTTNNYIQIRYKGSTGEANSFFYPKAPLSNAVPGSDPPVQPLNISTFVRPGLKRLVISIIKTETKDLISFTTL